MVIIRPSKLIPAKYSAFQPRKEAYEVPGFVIHPSTSELAERLQVDPTALSNENYSGIYDENGDYIPQYCDDPEKIPQGALAANAETTPDSDPASAGGADGPDNSGADKSDTTPKGDSE